jgi:hypothetical protein
LSISRDPGPKAGGIKGSGFLSIENDDPSAERMGQFLREAGSSSLIVSDHVA